MNVWVRGKMLNRIKSMYADNLACVRAKMDEREWFMIDSEVRKGFSFSLGCSVYVWMH